MGRLNLCRWMWCALQAMRIALPHSLLWEPSPQCLAGGEAVPIDSLSAVWDSDGTGEEKDHSDSSVEECGGKTGGCVRGVLLWGRNQKGTGFGCGLVKPPKIDLIPFYLTHGSSCDGWGGDRSMYTLPIPKTFLISAFPSLQSNTSQWPGPPPDPALLGRGRSDPVSRWQVSEGRSGPLS